MRLLACLALVAACTTAPDGLVEPLEFAGVEHRLQVTDNVWTPSGSGPIVCLSLDDDGVARTWWSVDGTVETLELGEWSRLDTSACGGSYAVGGTVWTVDAHDCLQDTGVWYVDVDDGRSLRTFPGMACE